jgi:hypothetical protein
MRLEAHVTEQTDDGEHRLQAHGGQSREQSFSGLGTQKGFSPQLQSHFPLPLPPNQHIHFAYVMDGKAEVGE